MAIVSLTSENPSFSFVIKKNPNAEMTLRGIRKGIACGWYSDEQTYNIYFKDGDNDISFKQYHQEFYEYLNLSRYNTPLFPLNAINEFFSHLLKKSDERDVSGYIHTFSVNMVYMQGERYFQIFKRHFQGFHIEATPICQNNYQIKISTNQSLHSLLQYSILFFLFLAMMGKEHLDVPDELANKYIDIMNELNSPYFIRYLFVKNVIKERRQFKNLRHKLEQSTEGVLKFQYGSTADQRKQAIEQMLSFNKEIVDIGCGEGAYAIPFAQKLEQYEYHAIDIDKELLHIVRKKMKRKGISNITTYSALDSYLQTYDSKKVDVLLTEVVEHMQLEEARAMVQQVLKRITFDCFILTTPNREFNTYYELEGFRHEDHKWEMTTVEFQQWIKDIVGEYNVELSFLEIGDSVNGIHTTQGVVIKKVGDSQ
ncbi:class I SAM-dependent methyltransferase [Bacillus massiliigorillae]|uniref:class I SAM-dependent methyltransferase n=1 Tax=Bacillus massiliigorillae TaxID=1243664 RepID=UPI00039C1A81|nr:class I SAM-dependent methyltransferase [Bacillus massiliigorillae]